MSELLSSGIQLMLVGMGTVFTFLTILVFATMAMSAVIRRISPVSVESADPRNLDEEIAAIGVALHRHRNKSS